MGNKWGLYTLEYLSTVLSSIEIIVKISISALSGLLLGILGKSGFKPANTRVLMIIAMSICLFMAISSNSGINHADKIEVDSFFISIIVIILAMISSVPILKNRGSNESIAIAVSIWMSGLIGIFVGSGLYFVGLVITLFSYLIFGYPLVLSKTKDQNPG